MMQLDSLWLPETAFKETPKYLNRFAELYERQGRSIGFLNDDLWIKYGRMIIPVGPPQKDFSISEKQAHELLKKAPKSLLVRYHSIPHDQRACAEWYAVICDKFQDLEELNGKHRKEIKKGLKNCDIRQLEASFIAECGYDVYLSAFSRYQGVIKPVRRDSFKETTRATVNFDDIYQYWGAFYNNKLIGYFVVMIYGEEAAELAVAKFIPEYLRYNPSDALIYTMNEYYLQNKALPYIHAGYTTVHHKTSAQPYVLRKFPFKKVNLNLKITYNYILQYSLKLTYPLKKWIGLLHHDLRSIYMLEEIRRKCASAATGG